MMASNFDTSKIFTYFNDNQKSEIVFVDASSKVTLNYQELSEMVSVKIAFLQAMKLPVGAKIGLIGGNSLNWMVWDLAISCCDYVTVAFIDEHKEQSRQDLANTYGCHCIVRVGLENNNDEIFNNRESVAHVHTPDLFSLVFSSGTTGRTKCLKISKNGLSKILDDFIRNYKITNKDCYYSFLPFNYFQQRALYLAAIAVGARIVIVPPNKFMQYFSTEKPTYCVNPPVFYEAIQNHLEVLARLGRPTSLKEFLGNNIRWMITAMAPIKRNCLDFFWSNGIELYETYGVTETGIVSWNIPADYKVGTLGKPAADGDILLTENNEVFIQRRFPLSLGYLNPMNEEKEIFLENGRIATGDIATFDDDGYLILVGRTKNAIVSREGKKFHPEEVERLIEPYIPNFLPVLVGGADVCENTLLLSPGPNSNIDNTKVEIPLAVAKANELLDNHKKIHRFFILNEALSPTSGHFTRNLKLDRNKIKKDFINDLLTGNYYNFNEVV